MVWVGRKIDQGLKETELKKKKKKKSKGKTKYYLLDVWGCVEPSAIGPYTTPAARDRRAKKVRARQDDEDILFWADVAPDGTLKVGPYTDHFFDEET